MWVVIVLVWSAVQSFANDLIGDIVSLDTSAQGYIMVLTDQGLLYQFDGIEYSLVRDDLGVGARQILAYEGGFLVLSASELLWIYQDRQNTISKESFKIFRGQDKIYAVTDTFLYALDHIGLSRVNATTTNQLESDLLHHASTISSSELTDVFIFQNMLHYLDDGDIMVLKNGLQLRWLPPEGNVMGRVYGLSATSKALWISAEKGFFCWNPTAYELKRVGQRPANPFQLIEDRWGHVWLSENQRLRLLTSQSNTPQRPALWIEKVKVSGQEVRWDQPLKLRYQEGPINIEYKTIYLPSPGKIRVLYSIDEGNSWLTAPRDIISLPIFEAGKYTFVLKALAYENDVVFSRPLKITVLEPRLPIWAWWVMGLAILTSLFVLIRYLFVKQQMENLQSKVTRLQLTAAKKAQDQKVGQLQMNPHFLFNALQTLQGLMTSGKQEQATLYTQTLGQYYRNLLEQSREDYIPLDQEVDFLTQYLNLEVISRDSAFEYQFTGLDTLMDQDIRIPPMLVQPIIENAVIHGMPSVGKGMIVIDFDLIEEDLLRIKVDVNVQGFGHHSSSSHKGAATNIIQERLQALDPKRTAYVMQNRHDGGMLVSLVTIVK